MTRLLAVSTAGRPMPRLRVLAAAGLGAVALALLAILQVAGDPANNTSGNVAPGWEMSWVLALLVVAAPLDGMRAVPLPLLGGCSASKAFARPPTGATPLPPDVDGSALCQVPGQPGGALLLVRDAPPRPQMRPVISRLLTAASGVADGRVVLQDLAVQRWRGVCGQP